LIKSSIYMATVAPGLEGVAESEILTKLRGAWLYRTFRGRVLFGSTEPLERIMQLKCADNLYAHVAWLDVGPHKAHLQSLASTIAGLELGPALTHLDLPKRRPAITVSASRSGKHAFSRFDAADAVKKALTDAHDFEEGDEDRHDIGFRLDIMDDDALISVKLTPPTFRFRGPDREFSAAALRPTVAHALVWLSSPTQEDVFLDPFCGSGSIAGERAAYPARRIVASDVSPDAVASATRNVAHVEVHQWDACALPLESGTVTTIVTNPPWGNQIGAGTDIGALYRAFLREARRVLQRGGKAILLTDQTASLEGACKELGVPWERLHTVSLHGLRPVVYKVG